MITARKRQTALFLILMLYLTAAAADQHQSFKIGDDVTLSCGNVIDTKNYCGSNAWMFSDNSRTKTLFEYGQIHDDAAAKSNRLSLTADCSLVVKKVSMEDAGRYTCRQYINGRQGSDSITQLSVIHMAQQNSKDKIILSCSVIGYDYCRYTVEWLNEGREEMFSDMEKSDQSCSATVMFPTSVRNWRQTLKCKVTNSDTKEVQLFGFRLHSAGGKKDKDSASTTKSTTMTTTTTQPLRTISRRPTTKRITTIKPSTTRSTNIPTESSSIWTSTGKELSTSVNNLTKPPGWSWLYIIGSAIIIIAALVIIGWKINKGNQTKKDEEKTTDPEDGVSYAFVKIKPAKMTKKKPRVPDTVTYSSVNTSAQATIDPDNLYCKI